MANFFLFMIIVANGFAALFNFSLIEVETTINFYAGLFSAFAAGFLANTLFFRLIR